VLKLRRNWFCLNLSADVADKPGEHDNIMMDSM